MKFKVTLIAPTVIRATITIEADSHSEAENMAADELKRLEKEHEEKLQAYHNRGSNLAMTYPDNPIDWDDSDAVANVDIHSLEVDEVEELDPSE
jgi:hypothetical protein